MHDLWRLDLGHPGPACRIIQLILLGNRRLEWPSGGDCGASFALLTYTVGTLSSAEIEERLQTEFIVRVDPLVSMEVFEKTGRLERR